MGPTAIYRGFYPKLPLTIPGAHDVHFSNRLQPRDQHAATDIRAIPVLVSIPGPPGTHFFYILARYARTLSPLSNTCLSLFFSADIVHFGYLVVPCAGTCSTSPHITPSGIYSALACSLSHCIAFTFQSHPLMLAFRIPIPGSTVLTPPFAFVGVLSSGSILTYMSRPMHSTCLHL